MLLQRRSEERSKRCKEVGETYSAIGGFFRRYELIYIVAEERDLVRVRTNYRQGEYVYLYHTQTKPEDARRFFVQYLNWINQVHDRPEWYNALTSNCTTSATSYLEATKVGGISNWDIRTILVGKGDQMLYELGDLAGNLPFPELKRKALINPVAQQADQAPDFSRMIRRNRPGFE